jgi:hypothetical protein
MTIFETIFFWIRIFATVFILWMVVIGIFIAPDNGEFDVTKL